MFARLKKTEEKHIASFEVEDNDYHLLNEDADDQKYTQTTTNTSETTSEKQVKFTPNILQIKDSNNTNERTGKYTQIIHHWPMNSDIYQTHEQIIEQQQWQSYPSLVYYCTIFLYILTMTSISLMISHLNISTNHTIGIETHLLYYFIVFFIIPLIFIFIRMNIFFIHNYFIAKYFEPLFIFILNFCMILFTAYFSSSEVFSKYKKLYFVYAMIYYFILRLILRLWIFFHRLQFRKLLYFWLLALLAFSHTLILSNDSSNGNIKDIDLYIFRSYILLLTLSLIVWNYTLVLKMFAYKFYHQWLAYILFIICIILVTILYFIAEGKSDDIGNHEMVFYVVSGYILLMVVQLFYIECLACRVIFQMKMYGKCLAKMGITLVCFGCIIAQVVEGTFAL